MGPIFVPFLCYSLDKNLDKLLSKCAQPEDGESGFKESCHSGIAVYGAHLGQFWLYSFSTLFLKLLLDFLTEKCICALKSVNETVRLWTTMFLAYSVRCAPQSVIETDRLWTTMCLTYSTHCAPQCGPVVAL